MSERKKYNLEGKTEVHPGIYYWNNGYYILVKDGEHYPISRNKFMVLEKECHGHYEEIVKHYKPRKKREVKKKDAPSWQIEETQARKKAKNVSKKAGPATWVHPDYIDPDDPYEYDKHGFRLGLKS